MIEGLLLFLSLLAALGLNPGSYAPAGPTSQTIGDSAAEEHKTVSDPADASSRFETIYDENGNVVSEIEYDACGDIIERAEAAYYENGQMSALAYYDGTGAVTDNYIFNENGSIRASVHRDESGYIVSYVYDESGNLLTSTELDSYGNIISYVEITYDESGNQLSYTEKDAGGEIVVHMEYTKLGSK